jgi:hypothetical protein
MAAWLVWPGKMKISSFATNDGNDFSNWHTAMAAVLFETQWMGSLGQCNGKFPAKQPQNKAKK